jgi:PAS domain S-box-containing protein
MKQTAVTNFEAEKYRFLSGGGEMGNLMRSKDWSASLVGPPDTWPQSLRTTLSIILNSKFPMFLFWGPELVCFYNDAYRRSLGNEGKHPNILGSRGEDYWQEIWPVIKPIIDQVLAGGEATWSEDQLIPIYRNGKMEDVYWTFSYSPVNDESGKPSGVFVTCYETTDKVITRKRQESNEEKLNIVIDASQLGTWELNLITRAVVYSDRYLEILGHKKGEILTHPEIVKQLHPDDLIIREKAFKEAFDTGILYYQSRVIWEDNSIHWIEGRGKVFYDEEGKPHKMIGTVRDITESRLREESMARMAAIVESSTDAIISKDLNGIITSWNAAAEQIFGYTEKEMIGQSLIKLIPPDRIDEETSILLQLRSGERVNHFETKRITKDKEILDVSLTISPIRGVHGNIIGASKIARNITHQKETHRLIAANEQKFRVLADSMPQFVWTGDTAGNLNYFNQAVYQYSGLSQEQIKKEGWLQIVHPDDREANVKAWMESVQTGTDFIFEHRFGRYDGEYRWQLSRAIPQRDAAGNIQMWVGTSTDIQEIKEQEQQKDFFISMASHELKTPITSIKGYVQLLRSAYAKSDDILLTKSLGVIDKQIVTLTSLISDLLDVSKIKSGNLVLNKQDFEITEMISEVASQIQHVNPDHNIIFSGSVATVFADRERISQVLINLLTNAVKYSPNSKEIIIKNFIEDDHVVVSVHDSGIGINKTDQEKIFERFYRVEGKDEKTYPGFGIGLFISSEIIQRHDGEIGVNSEPGKGSVFYFSIPVKK